VKTPFPNLIDAPFLSNTYILYQQKSPGEWPTQIKKEIIKMEANEFIPAHIIC
jgi:hypothetical protein